MNSPLLITEITAQGSIDGVLGIEVALSGISARPLSFELQSRSLQIVVTVLKLLHCLLEFFLLSTAFDAKVFESLIQFGTSSIDLRNVIVEVLDLLATTGDLRHQLVDPPVPVADHFSLVIELSLQILFSLGSLI